MKTMETGTITIDVSMMPDKNGGTMPTPDLLTRDEAIRYLRIDTQKTRFPEDTLRRYRNECGLKAVQVGKQVLFPKRELQRFIELQMERNPR